MFRKMFGSTLFTLFRKQITVFARRASNGCRRVILDCDVGTDDAVALFLLLVAEMRNLVKLEMICCTRGNTTLKNVCKNTVRLLEVAKRTDIPIYKGSYETLVTNCLPDENYHGVDGFGDLKHDCEPDLSIIRPEPSFVAMRDLILKHPKEITVIGIGPLTNIALLLRHFDDVKCNIKEAFIMGGNHLGVGNIVQSAEFNFFMDPEAACNVFTCAGCPVHVMTWEACVATQIPYKWRRDNLSDSCGETWKLIDRAEKSVYKNLDGNWLPCDGFLIAAMLYPELVQCKIRRHLDIELNGKFTRGQVSVDHLNKKAPNATILQKIDTEGFKKLMCKVHSEL